jgi:hypothetical protein
MLDTYSYKIATVYYTKINKRYNILFFEIRMPNTQKSAVVAVSEKYTMSIQIKEVHNFLLVELGIDKKYDVYSSLIVEHLQNIRGHTIDADLIVICASGLLYSKFCESKTDGSIFYIFSRHDKEIHAPEIIPDIVEYKDEVDSIEEKLAEIAEQENFKLPKKIKNHTKKSSSSVSSEQEIIDEKKTKSDKNSVELVFGKSRKKTHKKEISKQKEIFKPKKEVLYNHIFPEEIDISLGIIYVASDIIAFYKQTGHFEQEVILVHEQIEENENENRQNKILQIKKDLQLLDSHLDKKIKDITTDELRLKYQLQRLAEVSSNLQNLKEKSLENVKKRKERNLSFVDRSRDIESMACDTQKAIHELNLNIVRNRNMADEILLDYAETIKDLFSV